MTTRTIKNFNRKHLAREFGRLGFTTGVEVGVRTGAYSKRLCMANKKLALKSVDPYAMIYGDYQSNKDCMGTQNKLFATATERLAPYNCEIIRKTSLEAVRDFPYESIDFVYIDASHEFDFVMTDIIEWTKRVKKGGIVAGHDYKSYRMDPHCDVMLAVDTYAKVHKIKRVYLTDEPSASWWFIRK